MKRSKKMYRVTIVHNKILFVLQQKNHIYWPIEKGHPITHGAFQLSLQSSKHKNNYVERIITLTHKQVSQILLFNNM